MDIWDLSFCIAIGYFVVVGIVDVINRYIKWRERKGVHRDKPTSSSPSRHETPIPNNTIMKKNSFVAIDFEHLYPAHETACEVGAVKVVDGIIIARYHTTINPPADFCTGRDNSDIIGFTLPMLANSPAFPEVYDMMVRFIGDLPLVAHNASTERSVLVKCCQHYGLQETLLINGVIDTKDIFGGKGLEECCQEQGITLIEHHNPLHDAEATARLYLVSQGVKETPIVRGERMSTKRLNQYKEEKDAFDPSILQPLTDDEVANKNTPFFGRVKTVVTGQYTAYPDRNLLKQCIKELGADIDSSVSKNTKILVVGTTGVGPSKLQKAKEYGVRIITEEELYQWVERQC